MATANPHKISQLGNGTLTAIADGTDFPHSGLIKGLSQMARQNIVVKNNSNDFDISQSTANGGTLTVSAGTYLRDGKKYVAQYKTGTTAAVFTFNASELSSAVDKGYHLVVVDVNNFILVRKPTVLNKVPDYTSGDTIIAVFEYASTSDSGAMNIQYLTTDKTENSLSIAYNNSNVYTESGKITGDANSVDIEATITNGHINLVPNGSGRVNIISTDINDAELVISKDVGGGVGRAGVSLISNNTTNNQSGRLTLERTSGSAFIGMDIATDSRDGIRILTGDGSEAERMRINDDGKVAIGTATVDTNSLLAVEGAISLDEISAPTNTADRGQLYTNADNELHMIDGAGTDTVFLKSGKHSIWVPSSAMTPLTTNGCSLLTQVEMTAGRPELQVLDFAAAAEDFCQFTVAFPKSWNEGTVTFQPFWTVTGTNTGTAVWELTGISANDNYAINSGYPAVAATGAKAHSGASNDLNVSPESGALTITNPTVDSVTFFRLNLKVAASSQTGVVRLIGLKMFYDINAGNDE